MKVTPERYRQVGPVNQFQPAKLEMLLNERGLNQNRLAKMLGVSRATISRIMRGLYKPRADVLAALKKAFPDIPLDYYFDEDKEVSPGGHQ